jgi:hypothetical protein
MGNFSIFHFLILPINVQGFGKNINVDKLIIFLVKQCGGQGISGFFQVVSVQVFSDLQVI